MTEVMILKLLNNHIRRAFSNSASHYEALSSMQYEIGRELIAKIAPSLDRRVILDVGMGTGKLTNRLKSALPDSQVIGLDFADGMVQQAKNAYDTFHIIQGDARQLPFQNEVLDMIVSNLAYQWVENLTDAFSEVHRVLRPEGQFCATIFGRETLGEFFESLEKTKEQKEEFERLNAREDIYAALTTAGFRDIEITTEISKTQFENMPELLKWLKSIGANAMNRDFYLGPRHLENAAQYYENNFGGRWGITASFEIIWVKGKK